MHPRPVQHTFTCQVLSCPCRIFVSLKTTCLSPFGGVWWYFCQSNMFVPFWRCAQHDILSWHNFHTILELYLFSEVQQHREAVHDLTCGFLGTKFDTSGWLPLVADHLIRHRNIGTMQGIHFMLERRPQNVDLIGCQHFDPTLAASYICESKLKTCSAELLRSVVHSFCSV